MSNYELGGKQALPGKLLAARKALKNWMCNFMQKQIGISDIETWMVNHVADLLEIGPEEIEIDVSFDRYGLGSSMVYEFIGELSDWLGYNLEPMVLYNYSTIEALANFVYEDVLKGS